MAVDGGGPCGEVFAQFNARVDLLGQTLDRSAEENRVSIERMRSDTLQLVGEMDKVYARKFTKVDEDMATLLARIEALEAKGAAADAEQAVGWPRLSREMGSSTASTAPPTEAGDLAASSFFRSPDPAVLRLRAERLVPQKSAITVVEGLLHTAALEKKLLQWDKTEAASKVFTARMEGDALTATRRLQKLLLAQKNPDGTWGQLAVADPEGRSAKAWLDLDKSRAQVKLEMLTKRALTGLKEKYPAEADGLRARKSEGSISLEWTPLLRIRVLNEEQYACRWNQAALEKKHWPQAEVEAHVRAHIAKATPDVRWG